MKIVGSGIQIELPKQDPTTKDMPWPRLVRENTKFPWIKPDFDRMDISEDEDEKEAESRQVSHRK